MKRSITTLGVILMLFSVAVPSMARQSDLAQVWNMTPKIGHGAQFEAALAAHAQWRTEHNDPWTWTILEVVNGPTVGTFIARSGGHTWGDFDAYLMWEHGEAADRHFDDTVGPHLETIASAITSGDETNIRWPEDPMEAQLISLTGVNLVVGKGDEFGKLISQYHQTIVDKDYDAHYYFAWNVNGGEYDVMMAFPVGSWADFAEPEYTVDDLMKEVHGEEAFARMEEEFEAAIESTDTWMLAARPDLSVTAASE